MRAQSDKSPPIGYFWRRTLGGSGSNAYVVPKLTTLEPPQVTSPLTIDTSIEEIVENFSFLGDWEDRYGYLIELGRALKPLESGEMTDNNKVRGCVSQVWLVDERENGKIHFRGASDAHIVSGLVAVALSLFSGKAPHEIVEIDEQPVFREIGLEEHLTPQRSNGLKSMVQTIKRTAMQAA